MLGNDDIKQIAVKYYNDVYLFCFSKLDSEDYAAEITQEVFLLLQSKREQLEPVFIRAWLLNVADKKIMELTRQLKKNAKNIQINDVSNSEAFVVTFDECYDFSAAEIEKIETDILSQLDEKESKLANMIFTREMKYSEIAEELGTNEKNITVRAFRLKFKLRELIKKYATNLSFFVALFVFLKIF